MILIKTNANIIFACLERPNQHKKKEQNIKRPCGNKTYKATHRLDPVEVFSYPSGMQVCHHRAVSLVSEISIKHINCKNNYFTTMV